MGPDTRITQPVKPAPKNKMFYEEKNWPFKSNAKLLLIEIDRNIGEKKVFFWSRLERLDKCASNHVSKWHLKKRQNALQNSDFVSLIEVSWICNMIFCTPYLSIENESSDERGIDWFPMPQGALTPSFSGVCSTTFSGFRRLWCRQMYGSDGILSIYNFSTKKARVEKNPTPINAPLTQTHSRKIWRRNTSKRLRNHLLKWTWVSRLVHLVG